jgi:hypothetical protein
LTTIALDRRFFEWREGELSDPDLVLRWGRTTDLSSWDDILARRRVVLLAEAGSGKSEEMREQARIRSAAWQFAVYATVEDVDRDGLEGALGADDRARFGSWRGSDDDGWFFIDSVDEARLGRVRLERALRRIADGILGAGRRAHIVLSCRLTDWETRRDLDRLKEALPIPRDPELPPPPGPDELLVQVLHTSRATTSMPPAEVPLVVLMAPLDEERVRLFASAKGVPNLDSFIGQIAASNLWRFARRPLDLDWLVDFWREHGRLGSLAEMLEASLSARVLETNYDRARADNLDAARALRALERLGGALVLGRKQTIAIPDSELLRPEDDRPLDLAQVLPDLPPQDRVRLLTRPVFDPATYGRARLHNDNVGVVRAYLTAQWLRRLRAGNLSRGELFALLFATTYEINLVKPSMQETAAWLALWDEEVGREVARRLPVLLLTAGDPASLRPTVREAALADVLEQLARGFYRLPPLDNDSLKRFAQPDLGQAIRRLWPRYQANVEGRRLMLRLIWLGALKDCVDLAEAAAFDADAEEYMRATAGRALIAAGDDVLKRRYAAFVKENCRALRHMVIMDAIDGLFPGVIGVSDLLEILAQINVGNREGGSSVEWQAPVWIDRLETRSALEELLRGLLTQLGPEPPDIGHISDTREKAYLSGIAASATRLLQLCQPDEAPVDAIDAAITVGLADRHGARSLRGRQDVAAELQRTPARRRLAFWRAAERRNEHRWIQGRPVEHIGQIALFGYVPGLGAEDIDWLLADARSHRADHERKLAITTALGIWRDAGLPAESLARIEAAVGSDPTLAAIVRHWIRPPEPPPEQVKEERKYEALRKQNAEEQAERDRSWTEFIKRLRENPGQLREIPAPTAEAADARLYHLWVLLSAVADTNNRFAIGTVAPLEPMLGSELAAALRDALINFWRQWRPKPKSERSADERNRIASLDCMGIAGISLEAATNSRWAEQLSSEDADRAAIYGTLEINGLPLWFANLADAKPDEVRDALAREALAEISDPEPRTRYEVLDDISRAGAAVAKLIAPALFVALKQRDDIPTAALTPMLSTMVEGLSAERPEFLSLVIERFQSTDISLAALYLAAAFGIDADRAAEVLAERLEALDTRAQTELVQDLLPDLFGTGFGRPADRGVPLGFATLECLVRIAFRTIRHEEDRRRPSGQVVSPDARDNAEHARDAAFKQLIDTPGRATFAALQRLTDDPNCPIDRTYLRECAVERAHLDAENAPWLPGEAAEFEAAAEAAPSTAKDLQQTALRRFDDMQHDLRHGDFAQGATLKGLDGETAVQNWVAERLRLKQGRAYSVEREPHVVEEKEPDVRLRAKATDASVATEIKIAERWTIRQLEAALVEQLCGRYLRARDARHGALLLVHQHARPEGWRDPNTGAFMSFDEVVAHLRRLATEIASGSPDAPQPEIAVLDVSTCVPSR